jgi:response regulator RpfG family c-di-GMP phosphodiesterase
MKNAPNEKILFVDDEPNLLEGVKRQLHSLFKVETVTGGAQALEMMNTAGPIAVIVSDMRMPDMDGIQLLRRIKDSAPQTVRIMLSGNADLQTAMDAVNEGSIFRFLSKPCPTETLVKALEAGLEQYRKVAAEQELLGKTMSTSSSSAKPAKNIPPEKILFVDDELNVLQALQRQLRNLFNIETASSGAEALQVVTCAGPFAVVVADMRMPAMDGIQFLTRLKEAAPQAVRMMLSGNADQQTAVDAINAGSILRFLNKPCPTETLSKALEAGIEQYRLVMAEKELLEKTLAGCVKVLTEMLSMVNASAFGRASRVHRFVHRVVQFLKLPDAWKYELAASLSQIGCAMLPAELLDKVYAGQALTEEEEKLFASHPSVGAKLLAKIPRLESVAAMIEAQHQTNNASSGVSDSASADEIRMGAQILKLALDLDQKLQGGAQIQAAVNDLKHRQHEYNPSLLAILDRLDIRHADAETRAVRVSELHLQMILDEDLHTKTGQLLLKRGHEVNYSVLVMLRRYAAGIGVVEPFRVRVPVLEYGTH